MSKVTVTESYLESIGDAIREKLNTSQGYTPAQMAAAIESIPTGGITPTGTINITQNGTADVTQYASAAVNVPNSYAAGDEGKVVQSGALVAQTSETVTQNGTYDTTTKDEIVVNVSGGAPNLQDKTFTQNGTYTADAGYDGLGEVTVNVSGGSVLPSEYQQVEYIEFYGDQWIEELNVNLVANDKIKGTASLAASASTSEDGILGGGASSTYEIYFENNALQYYGAITGTATQNVSRDTMYPFEGTIASAVSTKGKNIDIGRYYSAYKHTGRVGIVWIEESRAGATIRKYIPCYRKQDDVIGFYEIMKGVFYTNEGSGSFGKGADV